MENNKIVKVAAIGFVGLVMVPIAVNVGIKLVSGTIISACNLIEKVKYNHKIKKGLKDGSIIELDDEYYEVVTSDAEEA